MEPFPGGTRLQSQYADDNLRLRGKGRKLAGRVKGEGGRCDERAVYQELGNTTVESKSDADEADGDNMATMSQGVIELWQNCYEKPAGGVVDCEVSCDWRFQPLPTAC